MRSKKLQVILAVGWLGAVFLNATSPGKFFDHYYLPLAAPLAILCGLSVEYLWLRRFADLAGIIKTATLIGIIAAPPLLWHGYRKIPELVAYFVDGPEASDVPRQIAHDINRREAGQPVLYVVDYQPIIYFLANSSPPTKFPFPQHLISPFSSIIGVNPIHEIERVFQKEPTYIIVSDTFLADTESPVNRVISDSLLRAYKLEKSYPYFSDQSNRPGLQYLQGQNALLYRRLSKPIQAD